jgi:hypothetical protein
MKQNLAWASGLVALSLVVACGETSNFVGEEPMAGSSGAGSSGAGNSGAGGSSAGKANGGSAAGGSKNAGGSSSVAGKGPIGGSDPGPCKEGEGNWVVCDSGLVHREEPGTCPSTLPRDQVLSATPSGLDECTKDTDCSEKPNGYCSLAQGGGFVPVEPHNFCSYGCKTDADCGELQACRCGEGIGNCVSSRGCLSDQDCDGLLCTRYDSCPGVPVSDFACQTRTDECNTNQDCTEPGKQFCSLETDHRVCVGVRCEAAAQ